MRKKADFLGRSKRGEVLDNQWTAQCRSEPVHSDDGRTRGREVILPEVELLHSVLKE